MRKSLIADIDVPLSEIPEQSRRRRQLTPPPLERDRRPRWKVTDGDADGPRWSIGTEPSGRLSFIENWSPDHSSRPNLHGVKTRSRFKLELREDCAVAGQHAPAGSLIECFAATAADLWDRVKILEEVRPAS